MQTIGEQSVYRSRFGGLWTDLRNAKEIVQQKLEEKTISSTQAEQLFRWINDGYIIIKNVASGQMIDRLNEDTEKAWEGHFPSLHIEYWDQNVMYVVPANPKDKWRSAKLLDLYSVSQITLEVVISPAIRDFLKVIFGRSPMAFQSLSFLRGTEQPIHQDTAYVVVSSPMEVVASWIALEDIEEGSGELEFYEGSHGLEEFLFQGKYKNMPHNDPDHGEYLNSLHEKAKAQGLLKKKFIAKKGDVLIWSGDLAHGGSKILNRDKTRRSIVTHYCPHELEPGYFRYANHSEKIPWQSDAYFCYVKR